VAEGLDLCCLLGIRVEQKSVSMPTWKSLDAVGGEWLKPGKDNASCVREFLPVNTFSYHC